MADSDMSSETHDLEKGYSHHHDGEKDEKDTDSHHQIPNVDLEATPMPGMLLGDAVEAVDKNETASIQSFSSTDSRHHHGEPVRLQLSRAASSVRSAQREAIKVPVAQRRGLFSRLSVVAEITDPYAYPRKTKWFITFIIAIAGAAAPMGSALILPALHDIEQTFHSSPTVVNLGVALYMLSMSIFPLWWSSFSETLGRRTIYISSFVLFALFNALTAVSTNIGMFVAMRMLSGGAAASVQAVGAGTVADIWEVRERGRAISLFFLGPLCGPLISPILGGVLTQSLGWRSAQWFITIFGGVICILIILCLPETLRVRHSIAQDAERQLEGNDQVAENLDTTLTRVSTRKSVKIKTQKYLVMLRRAFIDPLRIVLYLQFPAVAIVVYYATVTFSSLYTLNISIQDTFAKSPYNYQTIIIGLLYLPNSVGYFLTSFFGGKWVDRIMHREAKKAGRYDEKGRLKFRPEDRMQENAWIGATLFPLAVIVYGWTAHYGVNIAVPMIANFFFGIGSMVVFTVSTTMLTEFMPNKASNGVALNNFCRNIFSCIAIIVSDPLLRAIGNGWLFTGLGVISLVSGYLTIWAMKKYSERWRVGMDERIETI